MKYKQAHLCEPTYVDVILPLPLKLKFTYQIGAKHLASAIQGVE